MFQPPAFFNRPAPLAAPALLGQLLIHILPGGTQLGGIIVETEAYLHENDPAAHSARGLTHATRALRMGPGTLYIHPMRAYVGLDIVTAQGSVLIRALQPTLGLPALPTLANGPGKLCRALQITNTLYGQNITAPQCALKLEAMPAIPAPLITTGPRIGLTKNAEAPLRFSIKNNLFVSKRT